MHDQGPHEADVTEGSAGIWERLHYDWSDPHRVVMTTTDSNVWGGDSGHTYTLTRTPTGRPMDAVVVREGKNLKGRVLGLCSLLFGKRSWARSWERPSRRSKPKQRGDLTRPTTGGLTTVVRERPYAAAGSAIARCPARRCA